MKIEDALGLVPCYLPDDECWEFQGFLNHDGYGQISDEERKTRRVHRLMYEAYYGSLATGEIVRHTCDNPACCNPHHLVVGTQADNVQDCLDRDRFPDRSGEANGRAKLTLQTVLDIRKIYSSGMWSYGLLSQLFDVPRPTIAHIIKGYTWPACNHEQERKKTPENI